jgi:hypothetical protein
MKCIAIDGFIPEISDPMVLATVSLCGIPSEKCKADGGGMCKNGFQATVSNISVPSAGATIADPGPFTVSFSATATKTKADGTLVLLEGDKTETIKATPKIPPIPPAVEPVPYPVSFELSIASAGQVKVRGN